LSREGGRERKEHGLKRLDVGYRGFRTLERLFTGSFRKTLDFI
jgi:hypothetical protein